ncbi:MAG: phospholipase [Verrucomicrobia bacterium]|nr:MAG: phospholipase [Verrucomicrobiota bacterium]
MAGCATPGGNAELRPCQLAQTFKTQVTATVELNYLLYLPEDYGKPNKEWPLMLFLHGAGERGDNLDMVAKHGPLKVIREGKPLPFVIVAPQCPLLESWPNAVQIAALSALLDDIAARYRTDADRIYVTGLSMGGFGTWKLAEEFPHRFAAIAPICGKGDPARAESIKDLPIWVFHGAKDPVVPLKNSQDMVDALKKCGSDVKFTIYPEAQHDSWTETYNNPALYDWFLQHKRGVRP